MSESNKIWKAQAPSNIALIKYMGKLDQPDAVSSDSSLSHQKPASGDLRPSSNRPTNASISYTLPHLLSHVTLEINAKGTTDSWEPLPSVDGKPLTKMALSLKGSERFLAHLQKIKKHYNCDGHFIVRSANDFPSDCGLASSASSFAALTMAALDAVTELTGAQKPSAKDSAEWSRQGSGSSCRSFFAPWSVWGAEGATGVEGLAYTDLIHQVVVVNEDVKLVSSSEAHKRVMTSDLFAGRPQRAEARLTELLTALKSGDWKQAFEVTWAEFWDMHALFETSRPSFGYMSGGSMDVLRKVRELTWDRAGDGPLVTMDAGPNVHLLYRTDKQSLSVAREIQTIFSKRYSVYSSPHLTIEK